jgi:hypothetical protein
VDKCPGREGLKPERKVRKEGLLIWLSLSRMFALRNEVVARGKEKTNCFSRRHSEGCWLAEGNDPRRITQS